MQLQLCFILEFLELFIFLWVFKIWIMVIQQIDIAYKKVLLRGKCYICYLVKE